MCVCKKNQFLCSFADNSYMTLTAPGHSFTVTLQFVRLSHHQIKIRVMINGGTYGGVVVCELFMCHFSIDDATFFKIP